MKRVPETSLPVIHGGIDLLRSERASVAWIEAIGKHLGQAGEYLLHMLPTLNEVLEARRTWSEKLAKGRRMAQIADEFAAQHAMPRLRSRYCSTAQENYGRRCRHEILSVLSPQHLDEVLSQIRGVDDPGIWIGASQKRDPMGYVVAQARQR